jgi:pimeloyl-ACP methyl ester carboxylesterase
MEKMICIAGFGDDSSMFADLAGSSLSSFIEVVPFDLPGFGAPALNEDPTTLGSMARVVDAKARDSGARVVLAHSVASIIASLAALREGSPIEVILSLEGNLTAEDAYFSGTAASYDTPAAFRSAFLARLAEMADDQPIIARYHDVVEKADPIALWQLGKDAHEFSQDHVPGEVLARAANATYLFNPANLPMPSLCWLNDHDMRRIELQRASHWASIDKPDLLAESIMSALSIEKT